MRITAEKRGYSRQPEQVDNLSPAVVGPRDATQTGSPEGFPGEEN